MPQLESVVRDEDGQGLSEHALVLGFLALGVIVALLALAHRLHDPVAAAPPPPCLAR